MPKKAQVDKKVLAVLNNGQQLLIGTLLSLFVAFIFLWKGHISLVSGYHSSLGYLVMAAVFVCLLLIYFYSNFKYMAIGITFGIFAVIYFVAMFFYELILWPPSC